MKRHEQLKMLDFLVSALNPLEMKDRHLIIVGLLGWHIKNVPENDLDQAALMLANSATSLLRDARRKKGHAVNAPSDIRH